MFLVEAEPGAMKVRVVPWVDATNPRPFLLPLHREMLAREVCDVGKV